MNEIKIKPMTGPQLRAMRERAGVSALVFAKSAGVSTPTLMHFERWLSIRGSKRDRIIAAAARLDKMPRAKASIAPKTTLGAKPHQTGRALRAVRPGAIDADDPAAAWNGRFDMRWLRSQITAWLKGGVTRAELKTGDTSAPQVLFMASEAQLVDLGRRIGTAMTGKSLQE